MTTGPCAFWLGRWWRRGLPFRRRPSAPFRRFRPLRQPQDRLGQGTSRFQRHRPPGRRLRDGGQVPDGHHPHAAYVHLHTVATQLAPVLVAPSGTGIIVEMQPAGPLAGDAAQRTITGEGLCAGAGPGRGAIGHDHDVLGPLAQHPPPLTLLQALPWNQAIHTLQEQPRRVFRFLPWNSRSANVGWSICSHSSTGIGACSPTMPHHHGVVQSVPGSTGMEVATRSVQGHYVTFRPFWN